ncbi:hypothetical protein, partial [Actinomadura kijaniata]|uniref:hypothetical protein n=1 Tax=Actinomadura kijaniata TaxID=46161 RepID=UPI0031DFEEC2
PARTLLTTSLVVGATRGTTVVTVEAAGTAVAATLRVVEATRRTTVVTVEAAGTAVAATLLVLEPARTAVVALVLETTGTTVVAVGLVPAATGPTVVVELAPTGALLTAAALVEPARTLVVGAAGTAVVAVEPAGTLLATALLVLETAGTAVVTVLRPPLEATSLGAPLATAVAGAAETAFTAVLAGAAAPVVGPLERRPAALTTVVTLSALAVPPVTAARWTATAVAPRSPVTRGVPARTTGALSRPTAGVVSTTGSLALLPVPVPPPAVVVAAAVLFRAHHVRHCSRGSCGPLPAYFGRSQTCVEGRLDKSRRPSTKNESGGVLLSHTVSRAVPSA